MLVAEVLAVPEAEELAVPEAGVERVAQALAVVELVALARVELVQERVAEQELAAEMAPAAAAVASILLNIFTAAHTGRRTRTGSAQECFRFNGSIRTGLVAACSVAALLSAFTHTRSSQVGMHGDPRHTCATFSGLTGRSG